MKAPAGPTGPPCKRCSNVSSTTATSTYVIVHKIDRFARRLEDDISLLQIRKSGATLVSATENIDGSPSGRLTHGILASIAEYYSLNLSAEAKKGLHQKAKLGGTPGLAPIGYRNVRENLAGREIRTIAIDETRAPHVQWAFTAYASGAFTLDTLLAALKRRGLRARPTAKQPERTLSRAQLSRLLANPYYIGIVRYGGVEYPGRHQPLIDADTFTRAKQVLVAHNAAEERSWKHSHYLKGSLRCRRCGARLTLAPGRGKGGTYYLYWFCLGRQRHRTCTQPFIPNDAIEQAVERYYTTVRLEPARVDTIREAVRIAFAHQRAKATKTRETSSPAKSSGSKANDSNCSRPTTPPRSRLRFSDPNKNASPPPSPATTTNSKSSTPTSTPSKPTSTPPSTSPPTRKPPTAPARPTYDGNTTKPCSPNFSSTSKTSSAPNSHHHSRHCSPTTSSTPAKPTTNPTHPQTTPRRSLRTGVRVSYFWWRRWDSNPRPPACKAGALAN